MEDFKHLPVTVVAVSKFREQSEIETLKKEGFKIFAENRVQELVKKQKDNPDVTWHLIGHLQTNKVKDTVKCAELIHSVDSLRLFTEIDKEASKINKIQNCLIQVNVAKEPQKFGIDKEELIPLIEQVKDYKNICIKGIMVIAPLTDDEQLIKSVFTEGKKLFDSLQMVKQDNLNPIYLSMGMSHDYKLAIECGCNMVRIGRKLFDSYKKSE